MSHLKTKLAATAVAALAAVPAHAGWNLLNMTEGVTPLSRDIYGLHMLIFWICVVIAVLVFGAMIYSIIKFRKSQGAVADTSLTHSTKVEVVWTIIPVFILVAMAIPAAETLIKIEDTRGSNMTVKVTGYQWFWQYDYLDSGVSFYSRLARESDLARQLDSGIDPTTVDNYLLDVDNPMVVPVGAKVRVLLTANDVIHAWWVPAFGMKRDAIPGFINELWFQAEEVGTFRGQCAELCGRDHGFMPIVVEVKSQADYDAWVEQQKAATQQATAPAAAPQTAQTDAAATTAAAQTLTLAKAE